MLVSLIINLVYSFQEAVRFLHVGSLSNEEKGIGIITDCGSILLAVSHRNGKRRG